MILDHFSTVHQTKLDALRCGRLFEEQCQVTHAVGIDLMGNRIAFAPRAHAAQPARSPSRPAP